VKTVRCCRACWRRYQITSTGEIHYFFENTKIQFRQ